MSDPNGEMLWKVSGPGTDAIIWSVRYKSNESKALDKWCDLTGKDGKDVSATPLTCSIEGCWQFATQLLASGELSGIVPKQWWVVSDVELHPGKQLRMGTTSCPMCAKHARRFRRPMQERIFRLEERMDLLQRSVKDLEHDE